MKAVKYLSVLWAGVFLYALLAFFLGESGIWAYRQLQNELRQQSANIAQLNQIHRNLENTTNSLLFDRDILAVHAREQGYASANERFVRIVGLGISQRETASPGEIRFAAEPHYIADRTLRILAFFTGLTLFLSMLLFDVLKFLREQ